MNDDSTMMMAERRAEARDVAQAVAAGRPPATIGPLELAQYKKVWRDNYRFRMGVSAAAVMKPETQLKASRGSSGGSRSQGFSKLRMAAERQREEEEESGDDKAHAPPPKPRPEADHAVPTGDVAALLIFARLFDERPALLEAVRSAAPTVVIDVTDAQMLEGVASVWHDALFESAARLLDLQRDRQGCRSRYDAISILVREPPKGKSKSEMETAALSALGLALPFFALSPFGRTHLPMVVLDAAREYIEFPRLDACTIARTIRIVTGRRCREEIDADVVARTSVSDMIVAVRFDRSPSECVAELRRLASAKDVKKKSRDLTLSQLHGLGEARAWAEASIADIRAWKAGAIGWDLVTSAVALTGPPGTGKTTFAKVFAAEAGLDLITATLAKWQGSGEAHLGHLLRAMRQDFDAARARAPCVLFIDEIDSFPDRAGLRHAYKDYVIEVVNALLEQIDGIAGREGVVVIGASNDLTRCDPALLRSGRLDRIVRIGLPDPVELEKMLRVRLGADLSDVNLRPFAELAVGMTGADVERVVKDARRTARQASRVVTIDDLRGALVEEDDRPPELRWRACLHEAAHIVVDVLHFGADDVYASSAPSGSSGGRSVRTKPPKLAGTYDDYHKRLQIILAGRLGEELLLSSGSHGAGGAPDSDLDQATRMAAAMTGSIGLSGPTPLVYRGPMGDSSAFLAFEDIRIAVHDELSKAAAACLDLLRANRLAVEAVAQALFERSRVDGSEVARLLKSQGML